MGKPRQPLNVDENGFRAFKQPFQRKLGPKQKGVIPTGLTNTVEAVAAPI